MKIKTNFTIENMQGLPELDNSEEWEIEKEDVLIEVIYKTNKEGELTEHPFAVVKKFNIELVKWQTVLVSHETHSNPAEYDKVPQYRLTLDSNYFEVDLCQGILSDFNSLVDGISGMEIDFSNNTIKI